mmetsp:Transcript_354/g.1188  ORF Transcript_354/g.1188 Transcript_354/m.1188 type:complete len:235 (-) Transcript_354:120-824(-)
MSQTLNLQIKNVLDVLHRELRPMTAREVGEILKIDIENNEELIRNVESSTKLEKQKDGRWRWKSKFYVRSKDELIAFLRSRSNGVEKNDLEDCYKGSMDDVKDIIESEPRQLIVLKNSTTKRELLYPYEPELALKISDDIKERWEKVRVPDQVEVHRYLVERRLKSGEKGDLPQVQVPLLNTLRSSTGAKSPQLQLTTSALSRCHENDLVDRSQPGATVASSLPTFTWRARAST